MSTAILVFMAVQALFNILLLYTVYKNRREFITYANREFEEMVK